jgi:hypothetical protein
MTTGRDSLPYTAAGAGQTPGFMAGTWIRTPGGVVAVEALRPGDAVLTADGRVDVVHRLCRQTVAPLSGDPAGLLPVRLRAGALGEGVPRRDLLLSPHQAVLIDGVLVQAGALVNGSSIVRCAEMSAAVVYHQVEPVAHAPILAEDVPTATVVDAGGEPTADRPAARVVASMNVPPALRDRLAARGAALYGRDKASVA